MSDDPNLRYLQDLIDRLAAFYPKPEDRTLWLNSPHPLLAGDVPMDRILAGKREDVLQLIEQLETGAYV